MNFEKLVELIRCVQCKSEALTLGPSEIVCQNCRAVFPIIEGIPRFVPEEYYQLNNENEVLSAKTKNYFGYEWDYFKDWGFIPDSEVAESDLVKYHGGLVSHRKSAFASKCRLDASDLSPGKVMLDAGCGNGRYTFEAACQSSGAFVVGADIGYGSVLSAAKNTSSMPNVAVIQANLLDLPFKSEVIDSCFSNGVLMHTGDAERAFGEIARCIAPQGVFVAHIYQILNDEWEANDRRIREFTTSLSVDDCMEFARIMAEMGKFVSKFPGMFEKVNKFLRLQGTDIHMFDWYGAPIATHHTYAELNTWFLNNGFSVLDRLPQDPHSPTGDWSCNLKGRKN